MLRKVIILAFIGVVAGGVYVSRGTLETMGAMVMTTRDLFFPAKSEPPVASVVEPAKPAAFTGFPAKLNHRLMALNDEGTPKDFDTHKLVGVKYWAFYYSASWCGPCRAFTPSLVNFYRRFKPAHPNFELIFVNDDRNEEDMISYMKSDGMTWPAVWYAEINNPQLEIKKYEGSGIPDLVLVDADGRVLSDSFEGNNYLGPEHVLDDIRAIVK